MDDVERRAALVMLGYSWRRHSASNHELAIGHGPARASVAYVLWRYTGPKDTEDGEFYIWPPNRSRGMFDAHLSFATVEAAKRYVEGIMHSIECKR